MIRDFLTYLEVEQRYSRHTIEAYERDITQFSRWIGAAQPEDFDAQTVTLSDIRNWLGSLGDKGYTATTLRRKTQSLRAFYRWGMRHGYFNGNPAADVTLAKKRKKLPDIIKSEEIEEVLTARIPNDESVNSKRIHIILEMLYSLGLRQAELLLLTDSDINFSAAEIRITGKRNKQRIVPLPPSLAEEIKSWQAVRDARYENLPLPRPLITGPHGALSKQQLYAIVRKGLAGVSTGRRSPHTLRHTFATAMINNGASLDTVREMLGHASLSTTQIYTHLSVNELMASYNAGHPRAKEK